MADLLGLSLTQPWATLLAAGLKTYETRSWPTRYRGRLAIHASKSCPRWARDLCDADPFARLLEPAGYQSAAALPLGAIVGVATLVSCELTDLVARRLTANGQYDELDLGDYTPGRYAWLCEAALKLPEPIPCKGALGLWPVPPEIAAAVEQQLATVRGEGPA